MPDPPPPEGYDSWLDWAISRVHPEMICPVGMSHDRTMKRIRKELATLRAKAEFADECIYYGTVKSTAWNKFNACLAAIEKEYQ